MEKLTSWVGLGSEVFPNELRHAVRTRDEAVLGQDRLTVEQQKRSQINSIVAHLEANLCRS